MQWEDTEEEVFILSWRDLGCIYGRGIFDEGEKEYLDAQSTGGCFWGGTNSSVLSSKGPDGYQAVAFFPTTNTLPGSQSYTEEALTGGL